MLTASEVTELAEKILNYHGIFMETKISEETKGFMMSWGKLEISQRILGFSLDRARYMIGHEIGHRAEKDAPETAANMELMKIISEQEGVGDPDDFLNVVSDPKSDYGNLGRPWKEGFQRGLEEQLSLAKKSLEKEYDERVAWVVKMDEAAIADLNEKPLDFLSGDEYECYVLLHHDPRDWPLRVRDLAKKLKPMFQKPKTHVPKVGGMVCIRPVSIGTEKIDAKEMNKVGKALAGLYPNLTEVDFRSASEPWKIQAHYRKWRAYSSLIPVIEELQREEAKRGFAGYLKWTPNMPLREMDAQRSIAKYGVLIPGITTMKKVYEKRGEMPGKGGSGQVVLLVDKSDSMDSPPSKMERAVDAGVGVVECARRNKDRIVIITFDDYSHVILESTRDYDGAVEELCQVFASGGTRISDALIDALRMAEDRQATIIFTDCGWGDIGRSIGLLSELRKRGNVVIFLIGEDPKKIPDDFWNQTRDIGVKVYAHEDPTKPFSFEAMREIF